MRRRREQFERLLEGMPDALRPLITFLYYCGVRLGEALQITWPQVDLGAGLIRLDPGACPHAESELFHAKPGKIRGPALMQNPRPRLGLVARLFRLRKICYYNL